MWMMHMIYGGHVSERNIWRKTKVFSVKNQYKNIHMINLEKYQRLFIKTAHNFEDWRDVAT